MLFLTFSGYMLTETIENDISLKAYLRISRLGSEIYVRTFFSIQQIFYTAIG